MVGNRLGEGFGWRVSIRAGGWLAMAIVALAAFVAPPALAQATLPTTGKAASQTTIKLPDPLTPEAIRQLVSRLSDEDVRRMLLDRLDAVAAATKNKPRARQVTFIDFLGQVVLANYTSIAIAVQKVPILWSSQVRSFSSFADKLGLDGIAKLFLILAGGLVAGLAAELLVNRLVRGRLNRALEAHRNDPGGGSLKSTLRFLSLRLARDLAGLFVFFLVTRLVAKAGLMAEMEPYARTIMINLVVLPRLAAAFARFLLAPNRPEFRLVHTDEWTAQYLHRNQIGIALVIGFSIAIVTFNDLNGVSLGQSRLGFWLNLAVHLYIIVLAWRAWDGLVMMMRGVVDELTPLEFRIAGLYPWFAIAVSVLTWVLVNVLVSYEMFALLQSAPHYDMMALLLMAPALETMIRGLVRHLVPPMTGWEPSPNRLIIRPSAAISGSAGWWCPAR